MIPQLNSVRFSKNETIPLSQIIESYQPDLKTSAKLAHKYKRSQIETIRHDLLHEENLNYLCEVA